VNIDGEAAEILESVDLDLSGLPEGATVQGTGNVTVTIGIERLPEESTWLPVPAPARA
jgi:hypothetical protein